MLTRRLTLYSSNCRYSRSDSIDRAISKSSIVLFAMVESIIQELQQDIYRWGKWISLPLEAKRHPFLEMRPILSVCPLSPGAQEKIGNLRR